MLALAAISLVCAVLPYVFVERSWRWRWREIEDGRVAADARSSVYREGGDVPRFRERAPASVRLAAFVALWCGQLFVPIAFFGAVTLIVGGLGLLTIPLLITCAKLYRAGLTLLHRDPRLAYFRARSAAVWSLAVNGATLAVLAALTLHWIFVDGLHLAAIWLVMITAAVTAIVSALLLLWVTKKWEDALFAASEHPTIPPSPSVL